MPAVLKKCFDGFCQDGSIHVDTIGTILTMMGLRVKPSALKEIVEEIDEDGSGYLEFEEFCSLRYERTVFSLCTNNFVFPVDMFMQPTTG